MTDDQTPNAARSAVGSATDAPAVDVADIARRLKVIVAELETGVAAEPGDLMTPSEKLRAIADLIDRRAATRETTREEG